MNLDVVLGLLLCFFIKNAQVVSVPTTVISTLKSENYFRIKRQAGYVYNRPSVSFDLPSQPTVSTQAPNFDRPQQTQSQQMYYAYPVPSVGEGVVNIGEGNNPTGSTSSSAPTGYNYGGPQGTSATATVGTMASSQGSTGYTEPTQGTVGGGYATGIRGSSSASNQNTIAISTQQNTVGTTTNIGVTGYSYNSPTTPTIVPQPNAPTVGAVPTTVPQINPAVSTNAPKYLPPLQGAEGGTGTIDIPTMKPTGSTGTVNTPSDSYLPPALGNNPSPGLSTPGSIPGYPGYTPGSTSTTPGSVPVLNRDYLPPNQSITPGTVNITPSPGTQPKPAGGYLPPITSGSPTQGAISTPAPTYLPPVL